MVKVVEEALRRGDTSVLEDHVPEKDKIAKCLYRWIDKWGDEGIFEYKRIEDEIERFSAIDGCYVIRANVGKGTLSHEELVRQYKDLKYVEQTFRTMKTADINVRPIRIWKEKHAKGYILACFLAYLSTWEIKNRLEPILEKDEKRKSEVGSLQEDW